MRKEESVTSRKSESVKDKIGRFIVMLGGREVSLASLYVPDTDMLAETDIPERADEEKLYEHNRKYYRVSEIRFSGRPFIVIECGTLDELLNNVMEDIDPFPCDLPDDELINEVKYSLGIEPYPKR